jgi:hypothetical protein
LVKDARATAAIMLLLFLQLVTDELYMVVMTLDGTLSKQL